MISIRDRKNASGWMLFMVLSYRSSFDYGMALQQFSSRTVARISQNDVTSSDIFLNPDLAPNVERSSATRRSLLAVTIATLTTSIRVLPSNAAIDVSGIRQMDSTGKENSVILNQILSYDGSESTRIQEIQKLKAESARQQQLLPTAPTPATTVVETSNGGDTNFDTDGAATYAYRRSTAFGPRITKVGNYGEKVRCDDQLVLSSSSKYGNNKGFLSVSFEFPSDWLQLDKMLGGIQYVDQRNGDKLYVLKVSLPSNSNLIEVPKQFFGDAIFHPQGTLVRTGINVDEYKVKSSTVISDGSVSIPHRRLLVKYTTVTPNGLRTDRRGLVDAYEIDSVAYMMMTSSNAVKFDANGRERETVEAIVDSFRVEKIG